MGVQDAAYKLCLIDRDDDDDDAVNGRAALYSEYLQIISYQLT